MRETMELALLLLLYFSRCLPILGASSFNKGKMPKFSDTDMIELYHLRSFPLLAVMSEAGSFKLQTSGIALRSTDTLEIVVLEFKPLNMRACFLPLLNQTRKVKTEDRIRNQIEIERSVQEEKFHANETALRWDKRSTITTDKSIDSTYWLQSTFLGRINGVVYRNYLNFVEDYLVGKGKYFIPQSICSNADKESCFTLSSTGDTFVTASLTLFAGLSVNLHAIIPPRASEVHLLSFSEPYLFSLRDLNHIYGHNEHDVAVAVPSDQDSEPDFGSSIVGGEDRLENRHLHVYADRTTDTKPDLISLLDIPQKTDIHRNPCILDEDSPTIIDQDNDTTDD
eukprot:CAMPEP_0119045058 /NCGR_PEP_ID=MMETSP1177-20130426/36686_1 /TAXON_ID=2985 /ORGANISM="Ochromonas sp, Strain CCMP1899" /LENGTH=338 /DNA_ID=CAMNT_0007016167 /DNA_START=49 /DNA_END=1062 /DNA_ORIENTATION=-